MTFQSLNELPEYLQANLPEDALALYMAAYNRVFEKLTAGQATRVEPESAKRAAHEAALLAVETEFEQLEDGRWLRQPIGAAMKKPGTPGEERA